MIEEGGVRGEAGRAMVSFTPREKEILRLVKQGFSIKGIGFSLKIKEQSVKNRLVKIYDKLEVTNKTSAAILVIKNPELIA